MDEVATRSSDSPAAGISLWGEAIELGLEFLKIDRPETEGFSTGPFGLAFWEGVVKRRIWRSSSKRMKVRFKAY